MYGKNGQPESHDESRVRHWILLRWCYVLKFMTSGFEGTTRPSPLSGVIRKARVGFPKIFTKRHDGRRVGDDRIIANYGSPSKSSGAHGSRRRDRLGSTVNSRNGPAVSDLAATIA